MFASSSAASCTMHDASLTSTSDRSGPPVTLMITPRAPLTDAPSSSGLEIARRAASMRAVRPFGDAGAHHRQPHAGHDGLHVGEVEVDEPRHQDQIRDPLDRLPQHVVGGRERVGHRRGAVDDRQQPLVRNRDDRVDAVAQRFEARARPASARFLPSNLNGLVTTATVSAPSSLARLAITGARAGAGAAAEARRHEDHVGAVERLDDLLRCPRAPPDGRRSDRRRRRVPSSACRRSAASTGRARWRCSAWRSVLATMNSTPSNPACTIRLTALLPPPPTPTDFDAGARARSLRRAAVAVARASSLIAGVIVHSSLLCQQWLEARFRKIP